VIDEIKICSTYQGKVGLQYKKSAFRFKYVPNVSKKSKNLFSVIKVLKKIAHKRDIEGFAQIGIRKGSGMNKIDIFIASFSGGRVCIDGNFSVRPDEIDKVAKARANIQNRMVRINPALKKMINKNLPNRCHGPTVAGIKPVSIDGCKVKAIGLIH